MNDYFFVINSIEKQARGTLLGEIVKTPGLRLSVLLTYKKMQNLFFIALICCSFLSPFCFLASFHKTIFFDTALLKS